MPLECERLQGIPDGYTNIPYYPRYMPGVRFSKLIRDYLKYLERGGDKRFRDIHQGLFPIDGETPDGPRYKAIGNGMATTCIGWVLSRVDAVLNAIEVHCDILLQGD